MDTAQDEIESTIIRAAGGVIWRDSPRGREVAVIRRTRHGDEWTLPKGKLQSGESWSKGALREVTEETGCEVTLGRLAGCQAYLVDEHPKLVLFWNMKLVRAGQPHDSGEVKELRWLTVPEALQYLKHPGEKRILINKELGAPFCLPTFGARFKSWRQRFWLSASAQRLAELLACYSIELQHLIQQAEDNKVEKKSWAASFGAFRRSRKSSSDNKVEEQLWATSAVALLDEAKQALKQGDDDRSWHCFHAAQRMELRGLQAVNPRALQLRAQTLRDEALDKLKSWRKERVKEILRHGVASQPNPAGHPRPTLGGPPSSIFPLGDHSTMSGDEISEIAGILHGHFDNEAVKRRAQGKHLLRLIIVGLTLVGLWLVLLSLWPDLPSRMDENYDVWDPHLTIAVMLFGVLGASLSGILSTLSDPGKVKIPELLFSFRVTLARLVVGLLSSVAASVMLASGFLHIGELGTSTKVILLAALAAGFSERLVTGALKKAAGD